MDDFIRQRLEDPDSKKAEVRSWLEGNKQNTLGELATNGESIDLIIEAYDAGANEILAIEIDEYDGVENTGKLIVKLPSDPDARKRTLNWCSHLVEAHGFDRLEDKGQTHVFVSLD
jgi:hypothetical protein